MIQPIRILCVNPNTSADFTERIGRVAHQYAQPGTQVETRNPGAGPRSIEGVYDGLLAAPGILELVIPELDNFDAFLMASFGDLPVISALREITDKPVVGIAEASMYTACLVGRTFSVVTTSPQWKPLLWDAVRRYGLSQRCASIRAAGMPVLALEGQGESAYRQILLTARDAIEQDGAEVICLGSGGMAGWDKPIERELGVPVLDGVVCALKLLEGLAGYGLRTSKRGAYAQPTRKPHLNLNPLFEKPYR